MARTPASSANGAGGASHPGVDAYLRAHARWAGEIRALRAIALACGLAEELKWGCPCYTRDGRNIVLIHVFKEYCALLFFKGALLKRGQGVLVQQTKNVQAARQIRFVDVAEVAKKERAARACILEAIDVEKAGLKLEPGKAADGDMPEEFSRALARQPALQKAFRSLTPGRQRGYLLHFSSARRSSTREARVQKCLVRILEGKGLDD